MNLRFFKYLFASLILGFLVFFTYLPSDVHAESCSVVNGPFYNSGDTITVSASDYFDQTLRYAIDIINTADGQRTRLLEFTPYFTFFPLNASIPSVPDGIYNVEQVALSFSGSWLCSNTPIAIGIIPPVSIDLKIDGGDGPLTVNVGTAHTLSWVSQWATSCTASGVWSGSFPTNGTQIVNVNSSGTYTLTCTSFGSQNSDSVLVNVVVPPPVTVDLKMDGSDGPLTVSTGTPHTLSWTSQNANSCTASGVWSGSFPTSGTQFVTVSAAGTYTLTCSSIGSNGSDSVSVAIAPPSPTPFPTPTPPIPPLPTSTPTPPPAGGSCSPACDPISETCSNGTCVTIVGQPFPGPGGGSGSTCSITNNPAQISDIVCVVQRLIGVLAPAAAIIFLVMVLMAAFRFIKSTGDPKKIANARDTLKYAAFGVALVAAAWLILTAIQAITGVNVTRVEIP